jgi:hypothetical protein
MYIHIQHTIIDTIIHHILNKYTNDAYYNYILGDYEPVRPPTQPHRRDGLLVDTVPGSAGGTEVGHMAYGIWHRVPHVYTHTAYSIQHTAYNNRHNYTPYTE